MVYPKKLHVLHKRDVAGNQNPNGKVIREFFVYTGRMGKFVLGRVALTFR